jgi:hypothetical protein
MKVSRDEVKRLMAAFEQNHPVECYVCFDWNVWPLLRVQVAYEAVMKSLSENQDSDQLTTPGFLANWRQFFLVRALQKLLRLVHLLPNVLPEKPAVVAEDEFGNEHPAATKGEVVFLTHSGRRLDLNGRNYEIYSDPIVSQLNSLGVESLVWEKGVPVAPRYSKSYWIDSFLIDALSKQVSIPSLSEPPWFKDFVPLAHKLLGRDFVWSEIEWKISHLQRVSIVFEQWLHAVEAKLLVSAVWYDLVAMAATLAAKRLGVVSVDLQHGLQDEGHFAYSCWEGSPVGGYELVPNMFWNWGEHQAEQLSRNNPAFRTSGFVAAGNSWLNVWRADEASLFDMVRLEPSIIGKLEKSKKTILVTLQGRGSYDDLVLTAIDKSPLDWLWLIRLHPSTCPEVARRLKVRLDTVAAERVEYEMTTRLPLYVWLKACDVHVTGFSTCALEALVFGKATIIVTQDGVDSYGDYIEKGVMAFAGDGEKLIQMLSDFTPTPLHCKLVAQSDFVEPSNSLVALLGILESAGINTSNP